VSVISNKPAVDECNFNHFNTATIWDLVSFALWQALSAQDPCFANLLVDCVAARRPLNSALELDLDFERQIRPPPQATEEATASLEDLIKYAYQHSSSTAQLRQPLLLRNAFRAMQCLCFGSLFAVIITRSTSIMLVLCGDDSSAISHS